MNSCSIRFGKEANLDALTDPQVGFKQVENAFDTARIHRLLPFFAEPAAVRRTTISSGRLMSI